MKIENCSVCGGTHYGSYKCPFTLKPCAICGTDTIFACSDCQIDGSNVHVCDKAECRHTHEKTAHASKTGAE